MFILGTRELYPSISRAWKVVGFGTILGGALFRLTAREGRPKATKLCWSETQEYGARHITIPEFGSWAPTAATATSWKMMMRG